MGVDKRGIYVPIVLTEVKMLHGSRGTLPGREAKEVALVGKVEAKEVALVGKVEAKQAGSSERVEERVEVKLSEGKQEEVRAKEARKEAVGSAEARTTRTNAQGAQARCARWETFYRQRGQDPL